ncbi:hypothetical protein EYF80_036269 [Liparis tanakae]|uniref:Uncharacterized protein n=1 Tax=Liparis tanakae TaxID=230148 RepID=A0A4Z2GJ66_9TELE|nr:hypothetical protein EYF80_036269 [Liparis tanakae]
MPSGFSPLTSVSEFKLAALGLLLWILCLVWRTNTKAAAMSAKKEESPPVGAPAAGERPPAAAAAPSTRGEGRGPRAGGASAALAVTEDAVALRASSETPSRGASLQSNPQKPRRARGPMLSSGPEERERLKFILGASEDNSSDEDALVTKPPSGASQTLSSAHKSPAQQASAAGPQASPSGLK